jgi:hypothetical protein
MAMNPLIQGNLKSKTSWFGLVLVLIGAAEQSGLLELIPDEYKGAALSFIGFVTLVLRNLSTDSIADKTEVR